MKIKLVKNVYIENEVKPYGSTVDVDEDLGNKLIERGSAVPADQDVPELVNQDAFSQAQSQSEELNASDKAELEAQAEAKKQAQIAIDKRNAELNGTTNTEADQSQPPLEESQPEQSQTTEQKIQNDLAQLN